ENHRDPQVALCPWNQDIEQPDSAYRKDPEYEPSVERPLVYHLFGRLDQPASLVLTVDDYLNYLSWGSKEQLRGLLSKVPPAVSRAYSANALMFLGFNFDDWDFRVLLQSIANPEVRSRMRPNSVAVQVDLEEGPVLQPELARSYLEK